MKSETAWAAFVSWLTDGEISAKEIEYKMKEKMKEMSGIKRTERGWAGHFICADDCLYHRNTLLEYGSDRIVVSTIGRWCPQRNRNITTLERYEQVGCDRYFETMAFTAYESEEGYWDANTAKKVSFNSKWRLDEPNMELEADKMHEDVVAELTRDLINGSVSIEDYDNE